MMTEEKPKARAKTTADKVLALAKKAAEQWAKDLLGPASSGSGTETAIEYRVFETLERAYDGIIASALGFEYRWDKWSLRPSGLDKSDVRARIHKQTHSAIDKWLDTIGKAPTFTPKEEKQMVAAYRAEYLETFFREVAKRAKKNAEADVDAYIAKHLKLESVLPNDEES